MKKNNFTRKIFLRVCIPSIISAIALGLSDMADALIMGNAMGEEALAAISICMPIYFAIQMLIEGLCISGSAKFSALLGNGEDKKAVKYYQDIILFAIGIGVVIAVLGFIFVRPLAMLLGCSPEDGQLFEYVTDYATIILLGAPIALFSFVTNTFFVADNKEKLASIANVVMICFNLTMNSVLVLGFDMGIRGAAIATVGSYAVSSLFYLPSILKKSGFVYFSKVKFDIKEGFHSLHTGLSYSLQYLYKFIFLIIVNQGLMSTVGRNGSAAFDVILSISTLAVFLQQSISKALTPISSTYYGEQYKEGQRECLNLALFAGCLLNIVILLPITLFSDNICGLFGVTDGQVIETVRFGLRFYFFGSLFGSFSEVLQSYFYTCEQSKKVFLLTLLRGFAFLIPCTLIASFWGVNYCWALYPLSESLSFIIFLIYNKLKKEPDPESREESKTFSYTIVGKSEDISLLSQKVNDFAEENNINLKTAFATSMAMEEICVAIMEKGFANMKDGIIQVTVVATKDGDMELHIRDNAVKFNPFSLETNKANEDGDFDMSAMGILVIKNKAKEFFYRQYQGFNTLVVKL